MDQAPYELNTTRKRILSLVASDDRQWNTADLARQLEMTGSNIRKQSQALIDQELLYLAGKEDVGAPEPAHVYGITDDGEALLDSVEDPLTLPQAQAQIDHLSREIAELEEGVGELEDVQAEIEARLDRMESNFNTLVERLENANIWD